MGEQTHIANALTFELSKVKTPVIRERVISHLLNIDETLANKVAAALGLKKMPKPAEVDYDQPLWMYSVLIATFLEGGEAIADEISNRHPDYTPTDTQAMFERKLTERTERGIGWPSCAVIHGAGCKSCASCPFLALGKSPLHLTGPDNTTVTNLGSRSNTAAAMSGQPSLPLKTRSPLHGGVYSPTDAMALLNSHYLIGKSELDVAIFRIKDDGSLVFVPSDQFKLDVDNIFVRQVEDKPPKPVERFWKQSSQRHQRRIVFQPRGKTEHDEFNMWLGFSVDPHPGWQMQRRLVRHIWEIICRRDKAKFKYMMRWLAWAIQNPDRQAEVVIVLKSRKQGTGKSTLGVVMVKIFGSHGALVDDKERLLGRFNDWLETTCFVLGEEIAWAGDPRTTDKLKSTITANTLQVERKNGALRQIPNRLHAMMTTNHDHAVAAGAGDRRNVVYDVSDEHACDPNWFGPLYRNLESGGYEQFLHLLQNVELGDWHPRQIIKTAEAVEQQRMSADTISQWSRACIDADAVIGGTASHDLGTRITSEALRDAYAGYCKQQGLRPVGSDQFGKACTDIFGSRKRQKASPPSTRRPWAYDVPDGTKWQEKLDERLGIKK